MAQALVSAFAGPVLDRVAKRVKAARNGPQEALVHYMQTAGGGSVTTDEASVLSDARLTIIVFTGAVATGDRLEIDGRVWKCESIVPSHNHKWPRGQYSAATLGAKRVGNAGR